MKNKEISIAIRLKNEGKYIRRLLESVASQKDLLSYEIVALDSGSVDDGLSILKEYSARIYCIEPTEFQFGRSCNQIIAKCNSEYVLLVSGHVWFNDDAAIADAMVKMKSDKKLAAIYFKQVVTGEAGVDYSSYEKLFLSNRFNSKSRDIDMTMRRNPISNAAVIVRKSIWAQIPFPEVLASEDLLWAKSVSNAGFKLTYLADHEVTHNHNETPKQIEKRVRINKQAQLGSKVCLKISILTFLKIFFGLLVISRTSLGEAFAYAKAHSKAYL